VSPDQTPTVRVRLRYAAFDTFIEKFAPNVSRGGVFLASRSPQPVGTVFPFEIQLAGGEVALAGDGKVTWVREFDAAAPNRPYGMGVQFVRLDAPSREMLGRILARKAAVANGAAVVRAASPGGGSGGHRAGTNGAGAAAVAKLDTNVDLAAEYGVDEAALRRAVDRNWLGGRAAGEVDELEALLKPEPMEPATLAQALFELPRLLDPAAAARRRTTGGFRTLAELFPSTVAGGNKPERG
jgi:uncharacterized protein (TIGR02266 family)